MQFVYPFDHPHDASHEEVTALVGGKAANLGVMAHELGLPVPPGFVVSTEACRIYLAGGWPEGLDEELREQMAAVEAAVGRRFGDPDDPLLVSVRSGAPVSMPGMMDTILNLGLDEAATVGLAGISGKPEFAAACRDRLLAGYRGIVGVEEVPDDPWEQLRGAVEAVFRSWNSPRAKAYRAHEGIPDDLGTGVIVQTMVFGNLGPDSGTGVVFTRNPATGEAALYGDILFDAQGEDVVAGTHDTEPIAVLDERMPGIARQLREHAEILERHYADVCDIEFTIERGRLWMLQTRIGKRSPEAALRIAVEMAEDDGFPLTRREAVERVSRYLADPPMRAAELQAGAEEIASGLPASPGIAAGEIATSPDAAVVMADAGRQVVLVRRETSPDDVHGIARAAGILTSTGGLASHAAVVARGWGIPAVVGAAAVTVGGGRVLIGGRAYEEGDQITIDGGTGRVYAGAVAGEAAMVPEAATLLGWAEELGIDLSADTPHDDTEEAAVLDIDATIRVLAIKGFVTADGLAPCLFSTEDEVSAALEDLASEGLAEPFGAMVKLTDEGKARADALMEADREAWGEENAEAALEAFLPLDVRMKETVTAWQMREVDGSMVPNDHGDEDYDREVLARFAALHEEAVAWLATLTLPRLERYRARLLRAAENVAGGDHAYIASPRLDSYHNVWFELHEDLILLAGRTREDETAAGRA
jgi:pyruvate,orthophosphate dikinase